MTTKPKRPGRRKAVVLGRVLKVKPQVRSAKQIMREHIAKAKMNCRTAAPLMNMTHGGFRKYLSSRRHQTPPQYVDIFIERFGLNEDQALELRLQAAIDAGWQLETFKQKARP